MPSSSAEGGGYSIRNSAAITQAFLRLQRQATREGRGPELLRAARTTYERLSENPFEFGEALYRLPALHMQVRCAAIHPLAIHFAVCEDRPLVFIKSVNLLAKRDS